MSASVRLARAHHAHVLAIRNRLTYHVGQLWQQTGGPGDGNVDAFTSQAVPMVRAAQRQTVILSSAYIAAMAAGGTRSRPIDLDPDRVIERARKVDPIVEYTRPIIVMRTALSVGKSFTEALGLGAERVDTLTRTDVMLANREANVEAMASDERIIGYERVLSGNGCAFCAAASTQRYHTGDLMPLHDNCDCDVAPITGDSNPGRVINDSVLADLKQAGGPEYWNARGIGVDDNGVIREMTSVPVLNEDGTPKLTDSGRQATRTELGEPFHPKVEEHGELGPVLTDPRDAFTGPSDL